MVSKNDVDLLADVGKLRALPVARHWVPYLGKPVSTSTMYRWAQRGVRGVKLQVLRTTTGTYTSELAVKEFLRRVDAARNSEPIVQDVERDQLVEAGILPESEVAS